MNPTNLQCSIEKKKGDFRINASRKVSGSDGNMDLWVKRNTPNGSNIFH